MRESIVKSRFKTKPAFLSPTAGKVLTLANNHVSLEVEPSPVEPSEKTPALADTRLQPPEEDEPAQLCAHS